MKDIDKFDFRVHFDVHICMVKVRIVGDYMKQFVLKRFELELVRIQFGIFLTRFVLFLFIFEYRVDRAVYSIQNSLLYLQNKKRIF